MSETSDQHDTPKGSDSSKKQHTLAPSLFAIDTKNYVPKTKFVRNIALTLLALALVGAGSFWLLENRTLACGQDMVERHNTANLRGGSFDKEIETIAKEIEAGNNYQQDPTCVSMVSYYYAYQNFDRGKLSEHIELIRKLEKQGAYPHGELFSAETADQLQSYLESMESQGEPEEYEDNEIVL